MVLDEVGPDDGEVELGAGDIVDELAPLDGDVDDVEEDGVELVPVLGDVDVEDDDDDGEGVTTGGVFAPVDVFCSR